jgi:hypothetical protein
MRVISPISAGQYLQNEGAFCVSTISTVSIVSGYDRSSMALVAGLHLLVKAAVGSTEDGDHCGAHC